MNEDDYIDISNITITSDSHWNILGDDTIDLSIIDLSSILDNSEMFETNENSKKKIPIDIWAKMYNNGIIDD
jgi:hypothetical protein